MTQNWNPIQSNELFNPTVSWCTLIIYIEIDIELEEIYKLDQMAYLSGILHRPMSAAAAVAVAAVSWDIPNPFASTTDRLKPIANVPPPVQPEPTVSQISSSNFLSHIALAAGDRPITRAMLHDTPVASTASLMTIYHYARLAKPSKDNEYVCPIHSTSSTEVVYRWHLPDPGALDKSGCSAERSRTVVVLLGWLGAKQRHLKRYAEWYTKRGFHVVTFTFPMADIISYKSGGKAEENTELLASHLAGWVAEESGKNLVFHTFSNTGWLTYGVLLEKFQKHDPSVMGKIKGCIVDSAPVAAPDPQVWASGFSAAILKKQSVATKSISSSDVMATVDSEVQPKPAIAETALLVVLEKFFEVVLNLPGISRRLTDVLKLLSSEQPKCPQLYIYSSADRVIPATSVESFIERQRRAGHEIRACDFINSPHVDHYRSHPTLYTSQLTAFLEDCVLNCSDGSSH